ncbi:MAG: C-terminal binding protein [Chloroflexi bacterium]|nr:C-terminal binding protein [Chloroflexota bacterium]
MTTIPSSPVSSGPAARVDDLPVRWRQRAQWHIPGIVTFGGRAAGQINPADPTHAALLAGGIDLRIAPFLGDDGEVTPDVAEADVVISGGVALGTAHFRQLPKTRLLLRPYVGYDDIDVDAATAEGILVANVPDAFSEEVANHAMCLILAANRQLLVSDRYVRSGAWEQRRGRPDWNPPIHRLSVQTLGFVGFGTIARMVAQRAAPFGSRMVAYDPFVAQTAADQFGVTMVSLDQLLAESDVVTIHTFLHATTRHLLNAERIAQMKRGAYLVNTARGPIVDEEALAEALKSGHLAGAALDVMEVEPLAAASPLIEMGNVILTPHMASASVEGQQTLRRRIAEIARSVALRQLPERHVVVNKALYDQIAAALWPDGV